ncbi:MAG: hypothetical protein V4792_05365 [Pseudomonadota bacterium]
MPAARSRLLAQLDVAITAAANPIEAKCLRAERAGLLARQGQLESARAAIDELNAQLAWQPNTALRAWLALAEGLHGYYSTLGHSASTSIEQAYTLAQGVPALRRLRALAAAWLANMSFANDDMPRMAGLLREALDTALPEHRGARARAALVAGYAYHFAGDNARAQPWYEASRRHAIAEGDETHLSALMHNQAWMRASQARLALLFDAAGADAGHAAAVGHALLGAESIGHYDAGIGTASLGSLVPMLRAQVLTAQGRWADALALFDSHFEAALAEGLTRLAPCLLADRAWCEWHSGKAKRAQALAAAAEQALMQACDIDDRAMASARLAQVCAALGDATAAKRHSDASLALHAAHREQQQRLAALLDEALLGLDPKRA